MVETVKESSASALRTGAGDDADDTESSGTYDYSYRRKSGQELDLASAKRKSGSVGVRNDHSRLGDAGPSVLCSPPPNNQSLILKSRQLVHEIENLLQRK